MMVEYFRFFYVLKVLIWTCMINTGRMYGTMYNLCYWPSKGKHTPTNTGTSLRLSVVTDPRIDLAQIFQLWAVYHPGTDFQHTVSDPFCLPEVGKNW